jgi:hypothetical protein
MASSGGDLGLPPDEVLRFIQSNQAFLVVTI